MSYKCMGFLILVMSFEANADVVSQDVLNQIRGDYAAMDRRENIPLGAIQHVWNKTKGGVYNIDYSRDSVIKVRLREWMNTTVVLPRWEKIEQVIVGNEAYVRTSVVKGNVVIIKPQGDVGVDTNISIIGKGHTYLLYVRIEGYNSKNLPDIGINIHAMPPRSMTIKESGGGQKNAKDWLAEPNERIGDLDFKFSMSGSRKISPDRVYSNGVKIWLDYGDKLSKRNLPAVFLVEDGVDTPVNNSVIKNSIVVNGHGILTLKNGGRIACVYPTKLGRHKNVKK